MHQNGEHHHHQHPHPPLQRLKSLPDPWLPESPLKNTNNYQHVLLKMHHHHHHHSHQPPGDHALTLDPAKPRPRSLPPSRSHSRSHSRSSSRSHSPAPAAPDLTALLSDELLTLVLSQIPQHSLDSSASLVCKRWLRLSGRLRRRLSLRRWPSIDRLLARFPNLTDLDLVRAAFSSSNSLSSGRVILNRGNFAIRMDQHFTHRIGELPFIDSDHVDRGLETVARACPGLRKLSVAGAESGLISVADACFTLQEMELHRCTDLALRSVSAFRNLQILKLVGSVEGLYGGPGVSDIGLTILAHGCKRLVELEISGCEGSYDGISAIGRCCLMLEELTLCDHRMDAGWIAGLSFCGNLKTLRLQSCRKIDEDPGPFEHLGSCPTVERVQLQRCQLRDKRSLRALFVMCESAREIMFQNCWGLDDEMFGITSICRRVKFLSLEGCSQVTTEGLESVLLSWTDLKSLTVVSCNSVKDEAVTPAQSNLFASLKELKWRPDSKSVLAMSLAGSGMGKKGGRFFKRG